MRDRSREGGRPAPVYTDSELRRMRAAVEHSDATLVEIARRFLTSESTVVRLAEEGGWAMAHRRVKVRKAERMEAFNG